MSFASRAREFAAVAYGVGSALLSTRKVGRAPVTVVSQFQPFSTSKWSIESVLEALDLHEHGDFSQSARLSMAFGRDDRISAVRNTRTRALVGRNGVGFELKTSEDGDQRRSEKLQAEAERVWWSAHPESVLWKILTDAIDLGVSISRIHWDISPDGRRRNPRLEPWDMQYAFWSDSDRCYYVSTRDQGLLRVDRNTGEWFVYEPAGQFGWMSGSVRATGLPFLFRAFTHRDWTRYCEKHGVPILAITEPSDDPSIKADQDTKKSFYQRLRKIGRDGIIRLPQNEAGYGYKAEFIEPRDGAWQTFPGFLQRLDVNVAIHYLGQNLSTEVQGGSLAATKAQDRVRLDYLGADAETLSTALREQVWFWWGRFNFDWWTDEITPWPTWNTDAPEDKKAEAQTYQSLGTGLNLMKMAGFPVDHRAVAEKFRIPILSVEDAAAAAATEAERVALATKKALPAKNSKTISDGGATE